MKYTVLGFSKNNAVYNKVINARRMRARVTVLTLCVCLSVCVSPVYKALRRVVLQFEHNCKLYVIIAR